MIQLLLTHAHAYTLGQYHDTWGRDARGLIKPLYYEDLAFGAALTPGTYIFADLERLDDAQLELARAAWQLMLTRPDDFRLLNDPSKVLRRYELLKALHAAGINRFAAHRLDNGALSSIRFPAFLRHENEHDGALSALVQSHEDLDRAAAELTRGGAQRSDLLAVEYCETADAAGIYRKYSAFRVGDRFIARHLLHSRKWVLKKADLVDEVYLQEEREFLAANPHAAQLRTIFDAAHIEYGRIDYSLLDGVVQVWEINTNPMIVVAPHRIAPARLATQARFATDLHAALAAIDRPRRASPPLYLRVGAPLARRLGVTLRRRAARQLARALTAAACRLERAPAETPDHP
ncbi:MAG: hypothetical protein ABIP55_10445 [Tepidisphaeraceae bacterium]